MTKDELEYQIKQAKLIYAVSPKTKMDWAMYISRVEAVRARFAEQVVIERDCYGGKMVLYTAGQS